MRLATCLIAAALLPASAPAQTSRQDEEDRCGTNVDRWLDPRFNNLHSAFQSADGEALEVGRRRTLTYGRPIGRIEVDRENVVAVSAPTPDSLRVTARNPGEATVSAYARNGELLGEDRISVLPGGEGESFPTAAFPPNGQKVVAVDVQFAAVSSSTLKALGFNFAKLSGDLQGAVVSPSSLSSFSFGPDQQTGNNGLTLETTTPIQGAFNLFLSARNRGIGAVLSALQSKGLSQILAQPTLLVRSGQLATFQAGGEVPIPVPQSGATGAGGSNLISIEYKKFGVQLAIMPYVRSANQIVLKIAPDVSELDYSIGVQLQGYTVPGLRRRCAETTVDLGSGQSFVIAGLNFSNSSVTRDKVPLLGDIPVLGAFFKRQQNQRERQELIIVATPRLVDPLRPEDVPPLPTAAAAKVDPSIGDMITGADGLDQATAPFGVVRR